MFSKTLFGVTKKDPCDALPLIGGHGNATHSVITFTKPLHPTSSDSRNITESGVFVL